MRVKLVGLMLGVIGLMLITQNGRTEESNIIFDKLTGIALTEGGHKMKMIKDGYLFLDYDVGRERLSLTIKRVPKVTKVEMNRNRTYSTPTIQDEYSSKFLALNKPIPYDQALEIAKIFF